MKKEKHYHFETFIAKNRKTPRTGIPILEDEHAKKIIGSFLAGDMTAREAGKQLNVSHQGLINLVCALTRKWYQDRNIKEIY